MHLAKARSVAAAVLVLVAAPLAGAGETPAVPTAAPHAATAAEPVRAVQPFCCSDVPHINSEMAKDESADRRI